MITTVVLSLLAVHFVGIVATPGLGAIGLVLAPLIGVAGGPDDPFADEHVDKGSPAMATPRQATVSRANLRKLAPVEGGIAAMTIGDRDPR